MGKDRTERASEATHPRSGDGSPFDPSDARLPRGLRRFGARLARFEACLASAAAPAECPPAATEGRRARLAGGLPGHRLHLAAGRVPLFQLQALARLERGIRREGAPFEAMLAEFKGLEDALGAVDYFWAFVLSGERRALPEEVLAWAAVQHAEAAGRLHGLLEAGGWVVPQPAAGAWALGPRAAELGSELAAVDWPKPRKERRKLGAYLVERLEKVDADARALDLDDLEGGLHELRRKLRWFSIYGSALDGLLTLDAAAPPPPGWDRYLVESVVQSPHARLPAAPPGVEPLSLPAPLFHALGWLIAELGRVKDEAQETELLGRGLLAVGRAEPAAAWLGAAARDAHAAGAAAREAVARALFEDRLLLRMAAALAGQLER